MRRTLQSGALVVVLSSAGLAAQVPFERAIHDLTAPDPNTRFRAAALLKEAAYPEAAIPLAKAVTDSDDGVQLEAIAAELNIFQAERIIPRKRVGFIVEVRHKIAAEAAFSAGPLSLGAKPVPMDVLNALRTTARDENPGVRLEALYAFGALAVGPAGHERRALLREAGPDLAAMTGATEPAFRLAAARVLGRVFEKRPEDDPIEPTVGDALITALNENDRTIKRAAMDALGAMRYERAVQALTQLFQHYGRDELGVAAFDALGRIAHAASTPLFSTELGGKGATLKAIAIEALARTGDRTKLPEIQAAVGGTRDQMVVLAGAFASVLLSNATLDPLTEALIRPRMRDQARLYLIEIAPGRSAAFLRYAQDPDARLRADVADILGLAGDPAALAVVEPLMQDQDPRVALAAERAAARLRANRPAA